MIISALNSSISDALKTRLTVLSLYKLSITSKKYKEVYNITLVDVIIHNLKESHFSIFAGQGKWFSKEIRILSKRLAPLEDDFNQNYKWNWEGNYITERVTKTILVDMLKTTLNTKGYTRNIVTGLDFTSIREHDVMIVCAYVSILDYFDDYITLTGKCKARKLTFAIFKNMMSCVTMYRTIGLPCESNAIIYAFINSKYYTHITEGCGVVNRTKCTGLGCDWVMDRITSRKDAYNEVDLII